ncbi:MAG: hypothetical protein D6713_06895 [Deltaproteobacteria bacterium]|nr:MAG: hypothetical protein D6713_06895 [Deltaproteobacteria bacterium]
MDEKRKEAKKEWSPRWSLLTAIGSAALASACCTIPLLLVLLGTGGAWAGTFTRLEKFRPFFIALALASLALSFYMTYLKPPSNTCKPGEECDESKGKMAQRAVLWISTILVAGLIAFPALIPGTGAGKQAREIEGGKTVVLELKNLTCPSCAVSVRETLLSMEGVKKVRVTFQPPEAAVTYDPTAVSPEKILAETARLGFPSSVKKSEESIR